MPAGQYPPLFPADAVPHNVRFGLVWKEWLLFLFPSFPASLQPELWGLSPSTPGEVVNTYGCEASLKVLLHLQRRSGMPCPPQKCVIQDVFFHFHSGVTERGCRVSRGSAEALRGSCASSFSTLWLLLNRAYLGLECQWPLKISQSLQFGVHHCDSWEVRLRAHYKRGGGRKQR